jgi:hypothetical protein
VLFRSDTLIEGTYKIEQGHDKFLIVWWHARHLLNLFLIVTEQDFFAREHSSLLASQGCHPLGAGPEPASNVIYMHGIRRIFAWGPTNRYSGEGKSENIEGHLIDAHTLISWVS